MSCVAKIQGRKVEKIGGGGGDNWKLQMTRSGCEQWGTGVVGVVGREGKTEEERGKWELGEEDKIWTCRLRTIKAFE